MQITPWACVISWASNNADELKGLLLGLSIGTDGSSSLGREVDFWMREFDADRSGSITYEEFRKQLSRCVTPCSPKGRILSQSKLSGQNVFLMLDDDFSERCMPSCFSKAYFLSWSGFLVMT